MANVRRDHAGEFSRYLGAALDRLHTIWDEIGIVPEQRRDRTGVVMQHLNHLLEEMVREEESLKSRLLANVDRYGEELLQLCRELHKPTYEPDEGLSILQLEADLRKQVDHLNKEKHVRIKQLKKLRDQDQHLCDIMCTTPYYIPTGTVPTQEQLQALEDHVSALEEEKTQRLKTFHSTKNNIIALMEDLDQSPDDSFERDVVCETEDSFLLSTENMKALRTLHDKLETRQKESYALAAQLRERLEQLWNRLQVPDEERTTFNTQHTGYKTRAIQAIRDEIARCEELKIANLRDVVERTRKELASWWDKCYVGKAQREAFTAFYSDDLSEELLEEHESEVLHMKQYYEEYRDMFEKVERREVLWQNYQEFERKATDPTRFFNRGCNLLKEEKARKKLEKELPRVEEDVSNQIAEWEIQMGRQFLVHGQRYQDYIRKQWADYQVEKEQQKQQRHKAKAKQMEEELMFGSKPITPAKRRMGTTPGKTPNSKLRKLHGDSTRSSESSGYQSSRLGETMNSRTPRTPGSVSRISTRPNHNSLFMSPAFMTRSTSKKTPKHGASKTIGGTRKVLGERNCENDTLFSHTTVSSNPSDSSHSSVASVGHYTDFATGLNQTSRPNCRSSVVPNAKPAFF